MHFLRKIAFVAFLTPFAFIQADVEEVIVTAHEPRRQPFQKRHMFRIKRDTVIHGSSGIIEGSLDLVPKVDPDI